MTSCLADEIGDKTYLHTSQTIRDQKPIELDEVRLCCHTGRIVLNGLVQNDLAFPPLATCGDLLEISYLSTLLISRRFPFIGLIVSKGSTLTHIATDPRLVEVPVQIKARLDSQPIQRWARLFSKQTLLRAAREGAYSGRPYIRRRCSCPKNDGFLRGANLDGYLQNDLFELGPRSGRTARVCRRRLRPDLPRREPAPGCGDLCRYLTGLPGSRPPAEQRPPSVHGR